MFDTPDLVMNKSKYRYSVVAGKFGRLFGRSQPYHVERLQKTLGLRSQLSEVPVPRTKPPDSWVLVHSLQGAGGGILDPDDRLSDVVDDREQIIACYEEEGGPGHHHNVGDGTSASSSSPSSTASPTHSPAFQNHKSGMVNGHSSKLMSRSPEIFQGIDHQFHPFSRNGIEITGEELQRRGNTSGLTVVDPSVGSTLQVRRGSEPSLNCIGGPGDLSATQTNDRVTVNGAGSGPGPPGIHVENKRWSAAPIIDDDDEDDRLLKPHPRHGRLKHAPSQFSSWPGPRFIPA